MYIYIYTRVCIYMVRQLWIPNAAEPQVDTDVQMPGALRLNRTAFEATLILLHPRVNRCPSCRRSWMRMSPWDTMRFILSVQQNDQIATIHMGVVDVVTCCYGCRVQTVFSWGDSCEVRPHTGQETTTRRAHREHDWGQGTWHPRRTTENECHRMSKSIKNL